MEVKDKKTERLKRPMQVKFRVTEEEHGLILVLTRSQASFSLVCLTDNSFYTQ